MLDDQNTGLNAWQVSDASPATPNPSYIANLGAGTAASAIAGGWRFRALARFVDDAGTDGDLGIAAFLNNRAYVMSFDLTTTGALRVTLQDETPRVIEVTPGGAGAAAFNHLELASLAGNFVAPIFEGRNLVANWDGVAANVGHPGVVQWGSVLNLSGRRGVMNFNSVQFDIGPIVDPPGDFDWSGLADGEDLLAWQRGYGSTTSLMADADRSGAVNSADLMIWRQGFGVIPQFAGAAPEPTSIAMAVVASVSAWAGARRKHNRGSPTPHFSGSL